MRVIPPQHYDECLPKGYVKKDFQRFEQVNGENFGVLYSGEKIRCGAFSLEVGTKEDLQELIYPKDLTKPNFIEWLKNFYRGGK